MPSILAASISACLSLLGLPALTNSKYSLSIDESLPGNGAVEVSGNEDGMACYNTMVKQIVINVVKKAADDDIKCDTSTPKLVTEDKQQGHFLHFG